NQAGRCPGIARRRAPPRKGAPSVIDVERVDAHLAALPDVPRRALESLRATIRAPAPEADETIAYGMPAFRINGRFLLSYAAYNRHCSLFPASQAVLEACGRELEGHVAGRGTIQF